MPSHRSSAMLRSMARGQLLGKYPIAAAAFMSVLMTTIMVRLLSASIFSVGGVAGLIISMIVSFIISLLLGIINVGVLFMALKISCNEPIGLNDLIFGFSYHPKKIVTIQAVLSGINLIATLPATIFRYLYNNSGDADYLPLIIIFYIAGISVYCFVSLVFSQVFFLLLDFEDKSAQELLMKSHTIMNGHKKRLFFLWLSFVPLFLLSILSCCIGFIWVMPYVKVTLANFYMDLMQA
ncbi:MAG: DUF975 family protein [Lachnospiraceae bacterium]|nr:DUF975 family protein [Lachnospiraceae bacterium]